MRPSSLALSWCACVKLLPACCWQWLWAFSWYFKVFGWIAIEAGTTASLIPPQSFYQGGFCKKPSFQIYGILLFGGGPGEGVTAFLEELEVAWISNHIEDEVQIVWLLRIGLKGDACIWFKEFEFPW